jgi:hypothetical protein
MREAIDDITTPTLTARRRLEGGAFAVPPNLRPAAPGISVGEIPKVVRWKPGVSRSSFVSPPQGASQYDAPSSSVDSTLPPAPSARNKPSPRLRSSKPAPFIGSDLLLTRSDHRVVATDVLAIDRRERYRLSGIVKVLTEFLNVLAIGPRPKLEGDLDAFLPPEPGFGFTKPCKSLAGFSRYERARNPISVKVLLPGVGNGEAQYFKLAGAMFAYGELHHYRVVSGDGEMHLIPPDWVVSPPPTLIPADEEFMLGAGS